MDAFFFTSLSTPSASTRARAKRSSTTAFIFGFTSWIRAMCASTTSLDDTSRFFIISASFRPDNLHRSLITVPMHLVDIKIHRFSIRSSPIQ